MCVLCSKASVDLNHTNLHWPKGSSVSRLTQGLWTKVKMLFHSGAAMGT